MKISDLPDENDRAAVLKFAQSFNGYEHFGSFKACADAAKLQKRETLTDLQNELFLCYRAANHHGDPEGVQHAYRELLPYFRKLLESR